MASSFIWMDSTLQGLSNDTNNTKFGVRTKKLCKLQSMKLFVKAKALFAVAKEYFMKEVGYGSEQPLLRSKGVHRYEPRRTGIKICLTFSPSMAHVPRL